jgi:hypothetical protein
MRRFFGPRVPPLELLVEGPNQIVVALPIGHELFELRPIADRTGVLVRGLAAVAQGIDESDGLDASLGLDTH